MADASEADVNVDQVRATIAGKQERDDLELIDIAADRISATQTKLAEHKHRLQQASAGTGAHGGKGRGGGGGRGNRYDGGVGVKGKGNNKARDGRRKIATITSVQRHQASLGKLEKRLIKACGNGGEQEALMMIREGADLSCTDVQGRTALHLALANGESAIVEALVANNARFEAKDTRGLTPVHVAASVGDFTAMRSMIRAGARCNMPDRRGQTAVHTCVESGSLDVLAVLLKEAKHAALDLKDVDGLTPLLLAVHLGHHSQAGLLLRRGADATVTTPDGLSALHLATKMANMECIRALVNANKESFFLFDEHGRTATHLAATEGNSVVLDALLAAGAEKEILDESGRTPLHWAVVTNNMDCIHLLVKKKVDTNIRDKFGGTPLHYAIQQGSPEAVEALAAAGTDLEAADLKGRSALVWGIIHDKHEACKRLLEAGCSVNTTDISTWSPLHYACHTGRARACQLLLHFGAAIDAGNATDHTPLFRAVIEGHSDCVAILLAAGASEHLSDSEGRNCLHWAALSGQHKIATLLLEAGCPADGTDLDGMQPLHQASSQGHVDIATALLTASADPNMADLSGTTPLHWAALSGLTDSVRLLLDNGADATLVDKGVPPQTAYDFAMHGRHFNCARLLHIAGLHGELPPAEELPRGGKRAGSAGLTLPAIGNRDAHSRAGSATTSSSGGGGRTTYGMSAGSKPTQATPRRSPSPRMLSPTDKRNQKLESGWNKSIKDSDATTKRTPLRPNGLIQTAAQVNQNAEFPGLGGSAGNMISNRGGFPGKEKNLETMLAHREKEIRDLKNRNRDLAHAAHAVRAASPSKPAAAADDGTGTNVIANIEAKARELRETLNLGQMKLSPPKDGYLDDAARKQRRAIKKQVKAALEQVSKLRADTEMLANQLVDKQEIASA